MVTAAFVVARHRVSGLIALQGEPAGGIVVGLRHRHRCSASLAYTAVFILLSVATSRALLFGLGYVFIWEGLVTELFCGTRYLSVRQYCLGIADLFATVGEQDFEANLGGPEGLILAGVVAVAALVLAVRRLERSS